MGLVGVPGVTFTNWPDPYIHSSDDDLWQMDATQLKRNAVAVAAVAYYLATAGDADLPVLATEMYGRALERMSRDATTAMQMIASAPAGERAEKYARGANSCEKRSTVSGARWRRSTRLGAGTARRHAPCRA